MTYGRQTTFTSHALFSWALTHLSTGKCKGKLNKGEHRQNNQRMSVKETSASPDFSQKCSSQNDQIQHDTLSQLFIPRGWAYHLQYFTSSFDAYHGWVPRAEESREKQSTKENKQIRKTSENSPHESSVNLPSKWENQPWTWFLGISLVTIETYQVKKNGQWQTQMQGYLNKQISGLKYPPQTDIMLRKTIVISGKTMDEEKWKDCRLHTWVLQAKGPTQNRESPFSTLLFLLANLL